MSKFQVGDIVVGNSAARRYGITTPGCVVKVVGKIDSRRFCGVLLEPSPNSSRVGVGVDFSLFYDTFDLKDPAIQENE